MGGGLSAGYHHVERHGFVWVRWSGRGSALPLCFPMTAKLLTCTFQLQDREHVQVIASHAHIHTCTYCMHTPGGLNMALHGVWSSASSCCQQPIITLFTWQCLDGPSFQTSVPVRRVCVCLCRCWCMSFNMVMCQKIKFWQSEGGCTETQTGCLWAQGIISAPLCLIKGFLNSDCICCTAAAASDVLLVYIIMISTL